MLEIAMPSPDTAPSPSPSRTPVTLFYSYAHEDEALRNELQDHLMILERRGVIRSWHDRAIVPGHDWSHEIDQHLRSADVVLLLISKDFIASDYIMGVELDLAMQRQKTREAVVVPILLRQVDLQPEDALDMPFVDLLKPQGLPRDLKPVTSWANRDEAWTDVARGLRATVNDIRARRPPMPAAPVARGGFDIPARTADLASAPTSPPARSPLLERVIGDFTRRIAEANTAKGGAALDETEVRSQALHLIDVSDSKRVLWVDDHPESNAAEAAALAKLQIEVTAVRSTDEALARLAEAGARGDGFDLVISDWGRSAEGPLAGLRLMAAMRGQGHAQPVLYYHGTTGAVQRAALAATARAAGSFGEAVLPADLMRLVLAALNS
jgi:CheY-like chemotaxis protein